MTDVKAILSGLLAERDAIDRAIAGFKALAELRESERTAVAPRTIAPKPRKPKPSRVHLSPESWTAIVAEMHEAESSGTPLTATARRLSKSHGIPWNSITTNWRNWQSKLAAMADNGQQPPDNVGNQVQ